MSRDLPPPRTSWSPSAPSTSSSRSSGAPSFSPWPKKDGHVLWRRSLPFAPYPSRRKPQVLFATLDRVFHLGYVNDHASLLSGFDAMSGKPTLAFSVESDSDIGLDNKARLLWAHTPAPHWQTVAVAPMTTMKPRELRVSGKVAHSHTSFAQNNSLAGIKVCSLDGCVKTDRRGGYALRVKGRGFIPIWLHPLHPYEWAGALRGLPPVPRFHELYVSEDATHVDVEKQSSATWNPKVHVRYVCRE